MKKQYLRISIAAFFIAALTFSTSCSKKSSDDPKPTTTPTPTIPVATTKPAAPDTEKRKNNTLPADEGTGRPPLTDITVGAVTVKDQESQRSSGMDSENINKLDNLTGKGTTSGRFAETTTTVFGWFISDFTVNGVAYSDEQIYNLGLQQALFFNIDESGYYWAFDYKSQTWEWGTYGIDKGMTTLAIDFDENWIPNETYTIAKITKDRLVLTANLVNDDGDTNQVIVGLNGYDLSSNEYNGDIKTAPAEKVFLGNWNLQILYDASKDSTYVTTAAVECQIKDDGTWQFNFGGEVENGSWVIETIPGLDAQQQTSTFFYLYVTSYDLITKSIIVEKHWVYISEEQMVMVLEETSDPNDQDSLGDQLYFAK